MAVLVCPQVKEMSMGSSMTQVYQTLFGSGNIGVRHSGCFVFALLRDEKEGFVSQGTPRCGTRNECWAELQGCCVQNTDMSPLWGVCIIHPGVRRFYVQADGSLGSFQDLSLTGTAGDEEGAPAFVDVVVPRSYCLLTRSSKSDPDAHLSRPRS